MAATFSLEQLFKADVDFEKDRPLMHTRNQLEPRDRMFDLLIHEVREFNGKGDFGYFKLEENREDYRQQEVADMILFILSIYDLLEIAPDSKTIHLDEELLAIELRIPLVPPTTQLVKAEHFTKNQEEKLQ